MFIIVGIILTVAGAGMVLKSEWLLNNFGRLAWFEDKLGSDGGSRLGYKLIGIICLIVGIIMMTGSGNAFMTWLLGPLLQYSQPK